MNFLKPILENVECSSWMAKMSASFYFSWPLEKAYLATY